MAEQALTGDARRLLEEADGRDALERVAAELAAVAKLLTTQVRLRKALSDPDLPVDHKQALVADLLRGRAGERAAALADLWVVLRDGRGLGETARELARQAARRRQRLVAEVRSAVELDAARRRRLAEVLTRVTGRPVDLHCTVDASILGSVVVRIGDEVFDGSVRSRLAKVRERLGA